MSLNLKPLPQKPLSQETDYWCGPASMAYLFGGSQAEWAKKLGTTKTNGTSEEALRDAFFDRFGGSIRQGGLPDGQYWCASVVKACYPSLVVYDRLRDHWMAVTRHEIDLFTSVVSVMDPEFATVQTMSVETFVQKYLTDPDDLIIGF